MVREIPEIDKIVSGVAELMVVSAKTAPKTRGRDDIEMKIVKDRDVIEKICKKMEEVGKEKGFAFFTRDANSVRKSSAIFLIGVNNRKPVELNCHACGFDCREMLKVEKSGDYTGPSCIFKILDLGIAIGSALKVTSMIGVDSRVMYTVGVGAKKAGVMQSGVVIGIPLSATGKNIFFDRG